MLEKRQKENDAEGEQGRASSFPGSWGLAGERMCTVSVGDLQGVSSRFPQLTRVP